MTTKRKKYSKAEEIAWQIKWMNVYLSEGDGRGRLNSAACVYNGKVGYFFVEGSGSGRSGIILFSYIDDQIVITDLKNVPDIAVGLTKADFVKWHGPQAEGERARQIVENIPDDNQVKKIQELNAYLATGQGLGRLASSAVVYDGNVGYFFVDTIQIDGVNEDAILFANLQDRIVITAFPAAPKFWEPPNVWPPRMKHHT